MGRALIGTQWVYGSFRPSNTTPSLSGGRECLFSWGLLYMFCYESGECTYTCPKDWRFFSTFNHPQIPPHRVRMAFQRILLSKLFYVSGEGNDKCPKSCRFFRISITHLFLLLPLRRLKCVFASVRIGLSYRHALCGFLCILLLILFSIC